MKIRTSPRLNRILQLTVLAGAATVAVLSAVKTSAGIQGSGFRSLVAVGTVTQTPDTDTSAIIVGGVPYSTVGAVFQIDGHPGAQGQLHDGDIVSLIGTDSPGSGPSSAIEVAFNGNVQGAVSGIDMQSGTFFVLGQTVRVNPLTVFGSSIKPAGLAGLKEGDVVEVSAFANSVGELEAGRIESKGKSKVVRVVGNMQTLDPSGETFQINSLRIDYGHAEVDGVLADGVSVIAQGSRFAADGALIASQVQVAAPLQNQPGSIGRIQGLVTGFASSSYIAVNGQPVAVDAQTQLNLPVPLGIDVAVKVTGTFDASGVLVASEVKTSK